MDMNILAAIRREERELEKRARRLQNQLDGLRAAANALGDSAMDGAGRMPKRVLSAAARAKISRAAKRRRANVKAGARKAAN
jgi:ABC-type phosphate transport system auxiliary subunit